MKHRGVKDRESTQLQDSWLGSSVGSKTCGEPDEVVELGGPSYVTTQITVEVVLLTLHNSIKSLRLVNSDEEHHLG